MNKKLLHFISDLLDSPIKSYSSISGGDISAAYLVETSNNRFFLKFNPSQVAYSMFDVEKKGLEAIASSNTIAAPKVYHCEKFEQGGILLMEYIEPKNPTTRNYVELGAQLAALHQTKGKNFGWESDNFIGSLHQSNNQHKEWTSFYLEERIWPQLLLAKSKNLLSTTDLPNKEQLYISCKKLLGEVAPSLLHGDLWSGNYVISSDGRPYLIDPAVYLGHHEVDIAMTKLFGGFDNAFYNAYWEHFPRTKNEDKRNDLYQLYYLIVHLNLFGSSYYNSVKRIIDAITLEY